MALTCQHAHGILQVAQPHVFSSENAQTLTYLVYVFMLGADFFLLHSNCPSDCVRQLFLAQGPLRGNNAGVTSGGSLQCDFIIHIVGPKSLEQAVERVKNVLEHCEDRWITSVSFPAIGTGNAYSGSSWLDASFRLGIATDIPKRSFS